MRKYFAFCKVAVQDAIAYRGPMVVWLFGNILAMVVGVSLWLSVEGTNTIGGYSRNELVSYYIFGLFFQWLLNWLPFFPVSEAIKNGAIVGQALLKPISFWWREFFRELGWHIISVSIGLVTTLIAGVFYWNNLTIPSSTNYFLLILAVLMGILINFSFTLCLALVAFWTTKVGALDNFFWIGRFFFGGQMFPISFFSGFLSVLGFILPFRYSYSFTLEIFLNKLSSTEILMGFAVGYFWVIFFAVLYKIMWSKGRLVYTSFGN